MHEEDDMYEHITSNSAVEYAKLAVVLVLITAVSVFLNNLFGSDQPSEILRWFMGVFFVTFGTFKFIGYEEFAETFQEYDIIAAKSSAYAYMYPFIELFLGCAYLVNASPFVRDVVTLLLMSFSAYGVYKSIKAHGNVQCACLGNVIKLPLSKVSLGENLLMAGMAAVMLVI